MALLPLALRPAFIVRRNAVRKGVLGPSTLWKLVAVVVLGRGALQRVFGRNPELLGRRRIGVGHVITVAVAAPMTRKQAKRAGITRRSVAVAARADLEAAQQAS